MDKYLLAIVAIIIFSIAITLYVCLCARDQENILLTKSKEGDDYDSVSTTNPNQSSNVVVNLNPDDFTLLE